MGQTWYHCTPLYLYIHNIKLVFPSSQVCVGLEWKNIVLYPAECSIALAFPNLADQTHLKWDKLGTIVLPSTSTFIISSWFFHLIKFVLDWNGKT